MPRRQRFKPSRKPKPAIDTSEEIIQPTGGKQASEQEQQEHHDTNVAQRQGAEDAAEDRVPR